MSIALETFRLDNVIWVNFEERRLPPPLLPRSTALRRRGRYTRCGRLAILAPHQILRVRAKGVRKE